VGWGDVLGAVGGLRVVWDRGWEGREGTGEFGFVVVVAFVLMPLLGGLLIPLVDTSFRHAPIGVLRPFVLAGGKLPCLAQWV